MQVVGTDTLTVVTFQFAPVDGPAATPSLRTLGTGALQAAAGNDARLLANGEMGRVCIVDQLLGSDLTGARSGLPFATITAALAAALSGDCVWVMPGTYSESVAIPTGVTLRGIDERSVTIQQLLVTADTTLVTMGENSHLANVALRLTSAEHHTLIAVAWPGTTTETALWSNSSVTVDNSTAPIGGTSNVYGCASTGSGADVGAMIRAVLVHVTSIGGGAKRGIIVSGTATAHVHDFEVHVASSGGVGTYIGAETTNAGASLRLHFGAAEGRGRRQRGTPQAVGGAGTEGRSAARGVRRVRARCSRQRVLRDEPRDGRATRRSCGTSQCGRVGVVPSGALWHSAGSIPRNVRGIRRLPSCSAGPTRSPLSSA